MPPEPTAIERGLARYVLGRGRPVLLVPGPHRYEIAGDGSAQPLIDGILSIGRSVLTFDPPGSGRSSRPAHVSMEEMHGCIDEVLAASGVTGPIDALGHSMAGLVLLGYALARPERVDRLVLIATGTGGRAYMNAPGALWSWTHPGFPGLAALGILSTLCPNRAIEVALLNYIERRSFVDPRYAELERANIWDWLRPPVGHPEWHQVAVGVDYGPRLGEIRSPTLVLCSDRDPQFPLACSLELSIGIPDARLVVFEHSGHSPFIEEPWRHWAAVRELLLIP